MNLHGSEGRKNGTNTSNTERVGEDSAEETETEGTVGITNVGEKWNCRIERRK